MPSVQPILELKDLHKRYAHGGSDQVILKGVDLTVSAGEIVMLVGPSGSGKSSLLHLISGVDLPDQGDIQLLNRSLTSMTEAERTLFRRQHIGVVYQFFNLIPTLTVRENILLPLTLNNRMQEQVNADRQLAALGLAEKADRFPEQLSGGEQQRVAICRALVHKPALLLADEPTGSLDNETADSVLQQMLDQIRQAGMTLIMVTHSEAVTQYADRVLRLHNGQLETVAS